MVLKHCKIFYSLFYRWEKEVLLSVLREYFVKSEASGGIFGFKNSRYKCVQLWNGMMLHPSTYYTLPLPKDWGLEKLRSIFYPLMAYYNIFGKVLSDLARVTELVHSSPKFFLVVSCLYPYLTVFSPLNYSVGSVSHYLPTHFKTWVFDSQASSFEGMLEISEDSGKELADIWDFLG